MSNIAASIITIGDELLIGQTIDTNSAWIAKHLNALGIDVLRRVAVGDERGAIIKALDEELAIADIVLITGGLGPTSDDITKPLLCEYFGGKMKVDERVLEHLKNIFAKRNRPILERNMKQAEVPDNCTVLFNKMGTAPGMWFEKDGKIIISMPGVPFEMVSIMEDEVLPKLEGRFVTDAIVHSTIVTAGVGESVIADKIQDLEEALPAYIKLAYLPDSGMVRLRLTGKAKDKEMLTAELKTRQSAFAERLGNIVVALEDIPMEQVLGNLLKEKKKTLGLAESCTGGFIGHHITQVSGCSEYFMGSIVSYSYEAKEHALGVKHETLTKYGAVSAETVTEMVKGALKVFGSDYALAVSGVLGPNGGTERTAVGTVWMAVAGKDEVITKEFHFYYDRMRNKELTAKMGMLFLWRYIKGIL
jgi:nicotinamide-nucleotide amidase